MWSVITFHIPGEVLVQTYLLAGELLAAIAVAFGIIWESAKYGEEVNRTANRFVIIGVVFETIFSVGLFTLDEINGAAAISAAADANGRAANLDADNHTLEQLMTPRRLLTGVMAQREVSEKYPSLRQFVERENAGAADILVGIQAVPDFEALTLAADLRNVLGYSQLVPHPAKEVETGIDPVIIPEGVHVLVMPGLPPPFDQSLSREELLEQAAARRERYAKIRRAAQELVRALAKAGIGESQYRPLVVHSRNDPDFPKDAPPFPYSKMAFSPAANLPGVPPPPTSPFIFVEIGMKPMTETLLNLQSRGTPRPPP